MKYVVSSFWILVLLLTVSVNPVPAYSQSSTVQNTAVSTVQIEPWLLSITIIAIVGVAVLWLFRKKINDEYIKTTRMDDRYLYGHDIRLSRKEKNVAKG